MAYLESERFYYTELCEDDVTEKYVEWMNDIDVSRFLESDVEQYTLSIIKNYVREIKNKANVYLFGIYDKNKNEHIGNVKINCSSEYHKRGDIGIIVGDKNYWGQGVATESVRTITAFGFREMGLYRITAGCNSVNVGSIKVFEKAGYSVEGVIRKDNVFNGGRVDGILLGVLCDEI
jgi:[ribosomal protein S5]-alanine N-acetyltransferase